MAKGVEKTVLPLSSLPTLYLLRVWTDVSTCIKWFVLRDLQAEKVLTEKQECPPPSPACTSEPPGRPTERTSLSPGKASPSVNTLQKEVLKCVFEDV